MARDENDDSETPLRYKVIECRTLEELEERVERMLEKGWRLQGACVPFLTLAGYGAGNLWYCQTLVK